MHKFRWNASLQAGFTVVEVATVVLVIGLLVSIVITVHRGSQRDTIETVLQSDLSSAATVLEADKNFSSTYPATAAAADGGDGLRASEGTTFHYIYTPATNSYCLSASNPEYGARTFHITSTSTAAKEGAC